jgi:uroporphyrinogen-III decarboxylase
MGADNSCLQNDRRTIPMFDAPTTGKKKLLRSLAGEAMDVPPVWLMRQAGRYLPEYRATRAEAGDFLSLCYNSELGRRGHAAADPPLRVRRAILFADILLIPDALGADLWFVTGEGPRLSTITGPEGLKPLKGKDDIHDHLAPVYETVRILSRELPKETTLIGFAGAPWTVATYMIAGRGTPDQAPGPQAAAGRPRDLRRAHRPADRGDDRIPRPAGAGRRGGREDLRQLGGIAQGRGLRPLRARTGANGSRPS